MVLHRESMFLVFFFKQKTAYETRISDWSSDVCSSDLPAQLPAGRRAQSRRFEGFGSCALKEKIATGREIKADDVRANNAVPKVRARAAHHRGRTALACGTRGAARPLHQSSVSMPPAT